MEGSGGAGKITIIFDEEKVVRRRVRRLSDRFSRPGSSRSASALGVERLEMMEVSQPNVKQDKTETEPDLEEIKSKDQQLFSLISEGYEILNIRVPSKLPTVDEEESTELQDNLSYLDQTPMIKSRNHEPISAEDEDLQDAEAQNEEPKETISDPPTDSSLKPTEGLGDIDYFEKFTLLDVVAPEKEAAEEEDQTVTPVPTPEPEQTTPKDTRKKLSHSASEESFVFVSDVDIVGEHLDEVFYGEGPPADLVPRDDEEAKRGRMRRQSSVKESGSVLFESEETVLTPIYIPTGPPKIIDQILLDEPTAMSFMYSDLYEDAIGERKRSDEEYSEAESVTSEKSYKRCLTGDCEEEEDSGYLEKFILKDETPTVEVPSEVMDDHKGGRMMWPQNEFDISGCLIRVAQEVDTNETEKELKVQEVPVFEVETGPELGISQDNENKVLSSEENEVTGEKGIEEIPTEIQKHQSEFTEIAEVVHEAKIGELETHLEQSATEVGLPTDKVEITGEVIDDCAETPAPVTKIPQTVIHEEEEETQASESKMDAAIKDTELEIPKDAVGDAALEVCADCEPPVHAYVEVIEEGKNDIQTQVCIDLKEEHVELATESKESTLKIEDLGQLPEFETQEEAKIDLAAKPVKTAEQKQEVTVEAKVQLGTPEIEATVVKEMVSVGDEIIVLVPKGEAVEMDIEVSPQPDKSLAEQIEDHKEAVAEMVTPPYSEIKNVSQIGENAEVVTKEDVPLPVEEIQETVQKDLEKTEMVSLEPGSSPTTETKTTLEVEEKVITKEDAPLPKKDSQAAELKKLEKQENISLEPSSKPTREIETTLEVEDEAKVVKKEDVQPSEDEIPVGESHTDEQETNLGEPIYISPEEMPVSVSDTVIQMQTTLQLEEKDERVKHGEELTTVATEMCHEVEQTTDEIEPEQEMVPVVEEQLEVVLEEADLKPASEEIQNVNLDEQDICSVIAETAKQDLSISPKEEETEEFDYEIVTKHEIKESQVEVEPKEPEQELVKHTEAVSKDLEEETIDNKHEDVEEQTLLGNMEDDAGVRSTLKRFTPLEDLFGLHAGDVNLETADLGQNDLDQDNEMDITEDVQDVCMQEDVSQTEKKESPDVTMEEYEIITEQDTEKEQVEMEVEKVETIKEDEIMPEEEVLGETADSELMEMDYETIDAEEERQARLAAELEGLDWYCATCGCLLSEQESRSEPHQGHEVTEVDRAYDEITGKVSDWISELQGRSENIEDLVSELELAYNSVEDQCHESEAAMQVQNEEMMALVMEQYNSMSVSMEEEKKAKLEQLYDQIVSFQESIDSAKGTLETTAREADTDARTPEDIHARLTSALDSAMSLELGPKGLLVFEDYAKGHTSSSQLAQRKGIPVPQRPTLQSQEPGSATSSSVTVYWMVNPEDVIDCFQVYCMEDPQGAVSEEYRVTVKESYCVLEELEPDKMYKVWVMAVNYTGCSLPSERLIFKTAPTVPVIDTERCTVLWDTAIMRWNSVEETPGLSYTLEYCRQYELEGEGLRTITGIEKHEQKVLLQPNENYLFYIKAVNNAGASEQSEAALISTKGTRFHLLKATAHPALELSVDQTTLHYSQDTYENLTDKACPLILGEQLPVRGHYYWENDVSRSTDYRLGVVSSSATRDSPLGENQLSWCLQCTATSTGGSYLLVHNGVRSSLFVIDVPERVGVFLDFQFGRLCFFNALSGQLLGSFCERFTQPCHPAVGMDAPGSVEVCMVQELPEFVKDS